MGSRRPIGLDEQSRLVYHLVLALADLSTEVSVIVARRKPFSDIEKMIEGRTRVLVAGCGTCVAVCFTGGDNEAAVLASQLMISASVHGRELSATPAVVQRQCDQEFVELFRRHVEQSDAVVSLACGAGIQLLSDAFPHKPVFPGVDTTFIGVAAAAGEWEERCRSCGQCVIGATAAICPVTMCPKGLLNGPCSGSVKGRCELDPERECAWVAIHKRLKRQSRPDGLETSASPLRHDLCLSPTKTTHDPYASIRNR